MPAENIAQVIGQRPGSDNADDDQDNPRDEKYHSDNAIYAHAGKILRMTKTIHPRWQNPLAAPPEST
jgi:hypothetical protein